MISITRLIGGAEVFGDPLRDAPELRGRDEGGPVVVWNATRTCNLNCIHCYSSAERRRFPGELSTEEAKAMIDDLASYRVPTMIISGGEPLVRDDVLELAAYANVRGVRVTFSTNGTLIDQVAARRLKEAGVDYVSISFDGGEESHDRLRGRKGSYREALEGIRHCREADVDVGIRFRISGANADDLGEIFRLVEQENVRRLFVTHIVYSTHSTTTGRMDLTTQEARFVMDALIDQAESWIDEGRNVDVVTADNEADGIYVYLRLLQKDPARAARALEMLKARRGNCSGHLLGAIDSFGNVHPDPFSEHHTIGSVREKPFSEIWQAPKDTITEGLRDRRRFLKGRCATCLWVDLCNGNYRIRAEAATGDFWECDPACYLYDSEISPDFSSGAD